MRTHQKKSIVKNAPRREKVAPAAPNQRQAMSIRVERRENKMKVGITLEGKFPPPRVVASLILVVSLLWPVLKALCAAAKELGGLLK